MPLHPQITGRNGRFAGGSRARNAGIVPNYGSVALITVLNQLGLSDNLKLCLDAGDSASYSSGQSWLDTSGNGEDFFRGADGSATTSDPTFNGSAGGLSSSVYWSFDAGDYFTYDTTNPTWIQNLHKDNAAFTFMCWVYFGSLTGSQGLFGTNAGANTGIGWAVSTAQTLFVSNAAATVCNQFSSTTLSATTWTCLGVSVNEAQGALGIRYFQNGSRDTDTATYTSPSASNATFTAQIGARGNANAPLTSGSRMAMFAAWEGRALRPAEMTAFYQATRNRFGV